MRKRILYTTILGAFLTLTFSGTGWPAPFWLELEGKPRIERPALPPIAELVKKARGAVVNIRTSGPVRKSAVRPESPLSPEQFREFFERFFGHGPPREAPVEGVGSGFIINRDGYIVTNNHVVEQAAEVNVKLYDGRTFAAQVVGRDAKTDLALLKIEAPGDLPILPLGDSDRLEIGEWVVAIGNPFGFEHSVTVGIVSGKGRVLGAGPYDDFIQTDAAINPGNSGGPLLNLRGEVVGISSAIIPNSQIGFAIPVSLAKEILIQLKERGVVTRAWIGVSIQPVTPELKKSMGLNTDRGALVADVMQGSPAEKAGIQRGDLIIGLNGHEIQEIRDLPRLVANQPVGSTAQVKLLRRGQELEVTVNLGTFPGEQTASTPEEEEDLGIAVQEIPPELAEGFGMGNHGGILVAEVKPGSPAARAGIRQEDLILEVNREPVRSLEEFHAAVRGQKGDTVLFLVRREEGTRYIAVKREER